MDNAEGRIKAAGERRHPQIESSMLINLGMKIAWLSFYLRENMMSVASQ